MVDTVTTKGIAVSARTVARQGYWRGVFGRLLRDPGGVFVGAIILVLLALALFGPWLIVKDPYQTSKFLRLKPIGTDGFPLGSDELGRDMLSRLILGTRLSLFMGIVPVVLAFFIGGAIGIIAGYAGGKTNTLIMRTVDVFYAFPYSADHNPICLLMISFITSRVPPPMDRIRLSRYSRSTRLPRM